VNRQLDHFAIYAGSSDRCDARHVCNVRAFSEKHAVKIAKDQGVLLHQGARRIYAARIGRHGYAKLLEKAGFGIGFGAVDVG
jgi:hypothetical protein